MNTVVLSLDEIDRVRRIHKLETLADLEKATNISERTWSRALSTRTPRQSILTALHQLGARTNRLLTVLDLEPQQHEH